MPSKKKTTIKAPKVKKKTTAKKETPKKKPVVKKTVKAKTPAKKPAPVAKKPKAGTVNLSELNLDVVDVKDPATALAFQRALCSEIVSLSTLITKGFAATNTNLALIGKGLSGQFVAKEDHDRLEANFNMLITEHNNVVQEMHNDQKETKDLLAQWQQYANQLEGQIKQYQATVQAGAVDVPA